MAGLRDPAATRCCCGTRPTNRSTTRRAGTDRFGRRPLRTRRHSTAGTRISGSLGRPGDLLGRGRAPSAGTGRTGCGHTARRRERITAGEQSCAPALRRARLPRVADRSAGPARLDARAHGGSPRRRSGRIADEGFVTERAVLRLDRGLSCEVSIDEATSRVIALLDGNRRTREAFAAVTTELPSPPSLEVFAARALPVVRRLVELGSLVPEADRGARDSLPLNRPRSSVDRAAVS